MILKKSIIDKFPSTKEEFMLKVFSRESTLIGYINSYSYLSFRKRTNLLIGLDLITSDGIIFRILLRVFYKKSTPRLSPDFSSYMKDVFPVIEREGASIFLFGGQANEITQAVDNLLGKYPSLNIVGHFHGYVNDSELSQILDLIIEIKPEVLIIGMGTPLQENILLKIKQNGWQGLGVVCGALFSQISGASGLDYYPKWADKLHLRWLYRAMNHPKLFWRYFMLYPKSIVLFICDYYRKKREEN